MPFIPPRSPLIFRLRVIHVSSVLVKHARDQLSPPPRPAPLDTHKVLVMPSRFLCSGTVTLKDTQQPTPALVHPLSGPPLRVSTLSTMMDAALPLPTRIKAIGCHHHITPPNIGPRPSRFELGRPDTSDDGTMPHTGYQPPTGRVTMVSTHTPCSQGAPLHPITFPEESSSGTFLSVHCVPVQPEGQWHV